MTAPAPKRYITHASQAKRTRAFRDVEVPEWDGWARIVEMSGDELKEWTTGHYTTKGGRVTKTHMNTATERLLAICWRNEDNERIYTAADIRNMFRDGGSSIQSRLEQVALELSGQSGATDDIEEDDDEAGLDTPGSEFAEGNH